MISIKILEKEHSRYQETIERNLKALGYHEEQVEMLKGDIEAYKVRIQDLKTAVSKLKEQ